MAGGGLHGSPSQHGMWWPTPAPGSWLQCVHACSCLTPRRAPAPPLHARQAAPLFPQLLRAALDLVRECACPGRTGCPACVQHTECGEYNAVLHKCAAAAVLEAILEPQGGGGGGGSVSGGEGDEEAAAMVALAAEAGG